VSNKVIKKNSLPSTAHESQFSEKQKFHSEPKRKKPTQYRRPEQLTAYALITKKSLICLMIYILNQRAQHLLV
jgi:hypothetical protein